jgi:hypothetical protein
MWAKEAAQGTQSHKWDRLEQIMTTISNSLEYLVWRIRGTNRDQKEKRDVLRELSRSEPNSKFIYKKSYRHHVYMNNGVYERRSIGNLTCNQLLKKIISNFDEISFLMEFFK